MTWVSGGDSSPPPHAASPIQAGTKSSANKRRGSENGKDDVLRKDRNGRWRSDRARRDQAATGGALPAVAGKNAERADEPASARKASAAGTNTTRKMRTAGATTSSSAALTTRTARATRPPRTIAIGPATQPPSSTSASTPPSCPRPSAPSSSSCDP